MARGPFQSQSHCHGKDFWQNKCRSPGLQCEKSWDPICFFIRRKQRLIHISLSRAVLCIRTHWCKFFSASFISPFSLPSPSPFCARVSEGKCLRADGKGIAFTCFRCRQRGELCYAGSLRQQTFRGPGCCLKARSTRISNWDNILVSTKRNRYLPS